ncbi:unnamed protein product, partial [Urochloa humidicola]
AARQPQFAGVASPLLTRPHHCSSSHGHLLPPQPYRLPSNLLRVEAAAEHVVYEKC